MLEERKHIALWRNAFDVKVWKNKEKIDDLLGNIQSMESIIEKYLKKTEIDFPNLTDHSISHSNILWKYADIIVGYQEKYLNPLEAFILNSVFLLHDAGMCYSCLNNKDEIKNDVLYKDYIAKSRTDIPGEELELEALFYTVRQNHGDYALRIAVELLNGEEFFIGNVDYRQEFGEIIGKISKSHTCNINYIEREFGQSYSSPKFPINWSIDYKKLSFLLRTSDAANLDNLRTPKTLKMIEEIKGDSKDHWIFQKKLGLPILEFDGYLTYSTNNPFKNSEQKAWWYCYNALKVLDEELKNANNYFVSKTQLGFKAKSVKYIDDTLSLGKNSLRTDGWDSIDTTVRVSNPVHIASELGGEKLYGDKKIAIRELIQNSIDAIHVHRFLTGQHNLAVGSIKISLEEQYGEFFLTVADNGIGMSQSLMTNELLDFGGSYWKSSKFFFDFKGLAAKGFESIGKFGIGFFSAFMLGHKITVTSWKYGESINEMRTLDFYDGLFSNAVLRVPFDEEKNSVIDRGTAIKIKLLDDPSEKGGILFVENEQNHKLKSLVQFFVPSADVEIKIQEIDGSNSIISPNTVQKLNLVEFIKYINPRAGESLGNEPSKKFQQLPLQLIEIKSADELLGKLTLFPDSEDVFFEFSNTAILMSKGIRIDSIPDVVGYINSDEVVSIKRDTAKEVIPYEALKKWAEDFLLFIEKSEFKNLYTKRILDLQLTFNLHDETFPIARKKIDGKYIPLTISEFREHLKNVDEIIFQEENRIHKVRTETLEGFSNIYYGFEVRDLVINSESLNNSHKVIKAIIKEEWSNYEEINSDLAFFSLFDDGPYTYSWTFKRK